MYGYAKDEALERGLNHDTRAIRMFEPVNNEYGESLTFEFMKNGISVQGWYSPKLDLSDPVKLDKSKRNFMVTMTQFLTAFYPEAEWADLEARVGQTQTLPEYGARLRSLLPEDWQSRPVTLALFFNDRGYAKMPNHAWHNGGRFCWAHASHEAKLHEGFFEKTSYKPNAPAPPVPAPPSDDDNW